MRAVLDRTYAGALWLAALCLAVILGLVGLQLGARIIDGTLKLLGLGYLNFIILSLAEIAGYLLAASTFLALAGTLKAGVHVRTTMLLAALPEGARRPFELWALGFGSGAAGWMTWRLALLAHDSWRFNEISVGMLPVPLAIPQAAMVLGAAVLTLALADELAVVARHGRPTFRAREDLMTLGKEG